MSQIVADDGNYSENVTVVLPAHTRPAGSDEQDGNLSTELVELRPMSHDGQGIGNSDVTSNDNSERGRHWYSRPLQKGKAKTSRDWAWWKKHVSVEVPLEECRDYLGETPFSSILACQIPFH